MNTKISTQDNLLQTLHTLESENERMHDVIDKIRVEIEQRPYGIASESMLRGMSYERTAILEIIDKYKAESEDML